MSETSSGYAARASKDAGDIDGEADRAGSRGCHAAGVNPRTIEPGEYEVLLTPYAAVDLLDFFSYLSFSALPFMEKRSFMSGRIGERVMGDNVSIWDDGLSPLSIEEPFDYEGVPKQRVDLIDHGVAKGVVWDSVSRRQAGRRRALDGTRTARPASPSAPSR